MTEPAGKPRSAPAPASARRRPTARTAAPQPPEPFNLAGGLAGLIAGAFAVTVLVGLGYLLYQRLWGSPGPGLYVALGLFGGAGLYAGWIAGLMVYSAISSGPRGA